MPPKTSVKTAKATKDTKPAEPVEPVEVTEPETKTEVKTESKRKRPADPKNKEKKDAETKRFDDGVTDCCSKHYISHFHNINKSAFQNTVSVKVGYYIMEAIKQIQETEVVDNLMPDTFSPLKYLTINDVLDSTNRSNRRAVKTDKSKPVREQALPAKLDDEEEPEPEEPEPEEETEQPEETEEPSDEQPENTDDSAQEGSEEKRKNYVRFDRTGKAWLGFIVNRYISEYYHLSKAQDSKNVRDPEAFRKFTCSVTSKNLPDRLSRSIALAVVRNERSVEFIRPHNLDTYLRSEITNLIAGGKDGRANLVDFLTHDLVTYLKLLAMGFAQLLWTKSVVTINNRAVECVMRMLDVGCADYAVQNKYCDNVDGFNGLTHVLWFARYYATVTLPVVVPKPKKESAKRSKKAAKVEEPVNTDEPANTDEPEEETGAVELEKPKAANGTHTNGTKKAVRALKAA